MIRREGEGAKGWTGKRLHVDYLNGGWQSPPSRTKLLGGRAPGGGRPPRASTSRWAQPAIPRPARPAVALPPGLASGRLSPGHGPAFRRSGLRQRGKGCGPQRRSEGNERRPRREEKGAPASGQGQTGERRIWDLLAIGRRPRTDGVPAGPFQRTRLPIPRGRQLPRAACGEGWQKK